MIVVHGTKESQYSFGPVKSLNCKNCRVSNEWDVLKKTEWYTLYFIPIITFNKYLIRCIRCTHEEFIVKKEYQIYYNMLQVSQAINDKEPSSSQLQPFILLEEKLKVLNDAKIKRINDEKRDFHDMLCAMSNKELIYRMTNREGYSSAFLSAVEDEMKTRKI